MDRWVAKVDNRFGYEKWTKTKGFIKPLALGWIGGSREKVRGEYRV